MIERNQERNEKNMEKLNILGTGNAMTLDCCNTCFTLENLGGGAHSS